MLLHEREAEEAEEAEDEDEESVKIMFTCISYLVIFSSHFLHAVNFLPVLHLDVLRRQIETETESENLYLSIDICTCTCVCINIIMNA